MSIFVDIKKDFGDFKLNVRFEAGDEVVGLLGASGCGKSMTLRCIAGIVKPDEGRIVVNGKTLFDSSKGICLPPQRREVGLLFQNYALFPNMTVERNIRSVLALKRRGDERARCAALLKRFYIEGLEAHYPAQLSGGQQQRVALARIAASEPSILMLDEPLSALDSYLRWQLEGELIELFEAFKEGGGTVLYVSHNRDEVYRLCDRVCVMRRGEAEAIRTVCNLFESPNTLASSLLSGCKNYSRIERMGGDEILATDWGVRLRCACAVAENIRYIGVRAHYIGLGREGEENAFPCRIVRVTPDVFGAIVALEPLASNGARDFSRIRMEIDDKKIAADLKKGEIIFVRVKPEEMMLLME